MTAKRFIARLAAIVLALIFVTVFSVGVYHDVGGWAGVAVFWASVTALVGMARAFIWALDNWNAR